MTEAKQSLLNSDTPVLIVDDSVQFAQVLNKLLTAIFGYRDITIVNNADRAYEMISANPNRFRLMMIDFRLPIGMSGGELLLKLKSSGLLDGKVAFLMSSDPSADGLQQAQQAGVMGVLTKPFNREDLRRHIESAERLALADSGFSF